MPNPMYRYQMPTERLKDQIEELMKEIDELEKIIDEKNTRIEKLEQRDAVLTALENGGVDYWEGYEISLEGMTEDD